MWVCLCKCGTTVTRSTNYLNDKKRHLSCGCQTAALRAEGVRAAAARRLMAAPQHWQVSDGVATLDFGGGRLCQVDAADLPLVVSRRWYPVAGGGGLVYAETTTKPRVRLHNLLVGTKLVDHADGNGLNNRRTNLRPCTFAQNQANQRKQAGTKSRYKGVRPPGNGRPRWGCEIEHRGQRYYVGTFDTEVEAALAYDRKALELFGEFARLNFPDKDGSACQPSSMS